MTTKAPITTHILDTTTGRPAPNVSITLNIQHPLINKCSSSQFSSTTNADGRVTGWAVVSSAAAESFKADATAERGGRNDGGNGENGEQDALTDLMSRIYAQDDLRCSLHANMAEYWAHQKRTYGGVSQIEATQNQTQTQEQKQKQKQASRPFFEEVVVHFVVNGLKNVGEEDGAMMKYWHVPLLVGPFSYTTYRGS